MKKETIRKVKDTFKEHMPNRYWGDDLDVRYKLAEDLAGIKGKTVLDIGCNIGIPFVFMDNTNKKTGIDIDDTLLKKAREISPEATFMKGDIFDLQLPERSFDLIIMAHVMPGYNIRGDKSKLPEDVAKDCIRKVLSLLNEGGRLVLTACNGDSVPYRGTKYTTYEELCRILESLNAKSVEIRGWNDLYEKKVVRRMYENEFFKYMVHPKILSNFDVVWEALEKNMKRNVPVSKSFYVEIIK